MCRGHMCVSPVTHFVVHRIPPGLPKLRCANCRCNSLVLQMTRKCHNGQTHMVPWPEKTIIRMSSHEPQKDPPTFRCTGCIVQIYIYIYLIGILLIIFYNPHNLHKLRSFIRDIRPLTSLNKQDLFIAHMNVFNGTVEAGKFNMDNWMTKMGTFFE